MYIPHLFRQDDAETLFAFMSAHSFITLVSVIEGAPYASHIPVVVAREGAGQEEVVTITGHLAKANPQWRAFGAGETLAIFSGPHAYIAPALYEKVESVPTWNYIAVHAYGVPQIVAAGENSENVRRMLEELIASFDPAFRGQWDELSDRFREGMMQGIVGFRMVVTRLEGKYKLSQNRSVTDRENVAASLLASDDDAIHATGAAMRETLAEEIRIER